MDTGQRIELVARRRLCRNEVFEVFLDEIADQRGRRVSDYLSVVPLRRGGDGVTGVAILPVRADGRVGLLRTFRHPLGMLAWEIPKGFIDASEQPVAAARRELSEEAGLAAADMRDLGCIAPEPGLIRAKVRLFAAQAVTPSRAPAGDDLAQGEVEFFAPADALEMARAGEIVEPCALVALYRMRDAG